MYECPYCTEILSQHSIDNEFCGHCLADIDIDDIEPIEGTVIGFDEDDDNN